MFSIIWVSLLQTSGMSLYPGATPETRQVKMDHWVTGSWGTIDGGKAGQRFTFWGKQKNMSRWILI